VTDVDFLRYPIGRPDLSGVPTPDVRTSTIARIAAAPDALRTAVRDLDRAQLDTPYRAGGWTLRQVVHHVADSHMNAYIRFKWGLTEDEPRIRTYDEKAWAERPEARTAPVEASLALLAALHDRWVRALPDPTDEGEWVRVVIYPDGERRSLDQLAALYAWHGEHHAAHVTTLRARMGW
jgi:uncharacterized damage-inducible protein DinB